MGTHLSPAFYSHQLLLGPLCALNNQNHVDIRLDFFKWVCFFWDLSSNLYFCLVLYLLQILWSWKLSTPWRKCSFNNDGCVSKATPKGKGGLTSGTAMTRTARQAWAAAWIVTAPQITSHYTLLVLLLLRLMLLPWRRWSIYFLPTILCSGACESFRMIMGMGSVLAARTAWGGQHPHFLSACAHKSFRLPFFWSINVFAFLNSCHVTCFWISSRVKEPDEWCCWVYKGENGSRRWGRWRRRRADLCSYRARYPLTALPQPFAYATFQLPTELTIAFAVLHLSTDIYVAYHLACQSRDLSLCGHKRQGSTKCIPGYRTFLSHSSTRWARWL